MALKRTRIAIWLDIVGHPDSDAIAALAEAIINNIQGGCYDSGDDEYRCSVDDYNGMSGLVDTNYNSAQWRDSKPPCELTKKGCAPTDAPETPERCLCDKERDGAISWPPHPGCPIHKELLNT